MNKLNFTGELPGVAEEVTLERINKIAARNRFNAGKDVYITPCKSNPFNVWANTFMINNTTIKTVTFDALINSCEAHNSNNETGRYTAYYKIQNTY